MTKRKFNTSWLHEHINDPYVKQAKHDGYRTRAAYKLKEIDEQDDLIRPGQVIVDLGAAPGSWSQYVINALRHKTSGHSKKGSVPAFNKKGAAVSAIQQQPIAPEAQDVPTVVPEEASALPLGTLIALDLLPMEPLTGVHFIQGDFREDAVLEILRTTLENRQVDLVISDMAPNLSGIAAADTAGMEHLSELVLEFAQEFLSRQGSVLIKCFHGSGYSQIVERFKRYFCVVAPRKPKASRPGSAEVYILAKKLKMHQQ